MNPLYMQQLLEDDQMQQPAVDPNVNSYQPFLPRSNVSQKPFPSNPIANGVISARDSLNLRKQQIENQKRDTFSKSFANFGAAFAKANQNPQWGMSKGQALMSALGSALPAGVQAYQQQEDDIRNQEVEALENAWKMQQAEQAQAWQMQNADRNFDEEKRHHMAVEALNSLKEEREQRQVLEKQQKEMAKERQVQEFLELGLSPLGDGDPEDAKQYKKHTRGMVEQIPSNQEVVKNANNIIKIINKWDKRGVDMGSVAANSFAIAEGTPPSGLGSILESLSKRFIRSNMSPEMIDDIQILTKSSSDLVINKIKSMPGGIRPTDLLKRTIQASAPTPGMQNKAMLIVADEMKNVSLKNIDYAKKRREAQRLGFELPYPELPKEEMEDAQGVQEKAPSPSPVSSSSSVVKMRFPDGKVKLIPSSDVEELIKVGGSIVQ